MSGSSAADGGTAPFDRRAIPAGAVERLWRASDGQAIRVLDWPAPDPAPDGGTGRGAILFMAGRGDA